MRFNSLKKNLDKVHWSSLSSNPNIFTYDYRAMKDRMFRGGGGEGLGLGLGLDEDEIECETY